MIISVYYTGDKDEVNAFGGEYNETSIGTRISTLKIRYSETPTPVVILHDPAKDSLQKICDEKIIGNDAIANELDKLYNHVAEQLQHCGISNVGCADIRLFIHFGGQSKPTVKFFNKRLTDCCRKENFQCYAVSRNNKIPSALYSDDAKITPPGKEDDIKCMCEELRNGDWSNIRAVAVLWQALMQPSMEKEKQTEYLKKAIAKKWLPKSWLESGRVTYSEAEKNFVDGDPKLEEQIEKINDLLRETVKPDTVSDDNENK